MPPSDDTKELMTANNNSAGGGLSSSSSSIVASATSLAADEISSINSSTFIPAMSLTLQDHLSIVFETKRNSTMDKEKMQNLEDGVMAAAAAELSTDGSDSTVFTTALPSELEQQQPATSSLTEQGGEDPAAQQEECTDSQEHVPVGDDSLQSETSAAATSKDDNDDSEKSDDHGSSSSSENIAKGEPEKKEADGPLAMLRKGAVAAVGGTMVGVGLVMIPLPTPFGAVVASSGLAVLGTEFKEAKEMNEKLIAGAKSTVTIARDRLVKGIESMDTDEFDDYEDQERRKPTTYTGKDSQSQQLEGANAGVVKVPLPAPDKAGDNDDADDKVGEDKDSPKWLHMNPIEQQRQERLAKEKYRRENQTALEQTKQYWTKKTGSFLSRNLLPYLKGKEEEKADEEKREEKQEKREAQMREEEGYVMIGTDCDDDDDANENETIDNRKDETSMS